MRFSLLFLILYLPMLSCGSEPEIYDELAQSVLKALRNQDAELFFSYVATEEERKTLAGQDSLDALPFSGVIYNTKMQFTKISQTLNWNDYQITELQTTAGPADEPVDIYVVLRNSEKKVILRIGDVFPSSEKISIYGRMTLETTGKWKEYEGALIELLWKNRVNSNELFTEYRVSVNVQPRSESNSHQLVTASIYDYAPFAKTQLDLGKEDYLQIEFFEGFMIEDFGLDGLNSKEDLAKGNLEWSLQFDRLQEPRFLEFLEGEGELHGTYSRKRDHIYVFEANDVFEITMHIFLDGVLEGLGKEFRCEGFYLDPDLRIQRIEEVRSVFYLDLDIERDTVSLIPPTVEEARRHILGWGKFLLESTSFRTSRPMDPACKPRTDVRIPERIDVRDIMADGEIPGVFVIEALVDGEPWSLDTAKIDGEWVHVDHAF